MPKLDFPVPYEEIPVELVSFAREEIEEYLFVGVMDLSDDRLEL